MRILFLTDSLSDLDGVGRYAMRLIAAMEELEPGLEVEILLARKHRPTSAQVPAHWKVSVALPPDYFYYMSPARYWPSLAWGTWNAWRAARRCDLVHAIKDFPHSLVALQAARLARVPCVATAHGTYSVLPLLSPRHARRARWAYRRFAGMISVSAYTRRRILAALPSGAIDPARIHVIPNCVNAAHYETARTPAETGPCAWHGQDYTLGIGELKERKGHHLSLGAFCRLAQRYPRLHHYIVGKPSGDEYQARLERMAREAGCAERVHFLGNIGEEHKIDLLQRALVFVHTPVTSADGGFEGFGIVYLEASASGTPCIGTLDCGAEDAIQDGRTGFLVRQEVGAVEAALEKLLSDPALRARLGAAGREYARSASWKENAARVLEIYRKALA